MAATSTKDSSPPCARARRTPALSELAREILLLAKSRREALQGLMKNTTVHFVKIFGSDREHDYEYGFTEPVLWNPLELRWDDVSTRWCQHRSQLVNVLRAHGYTPDGDGFANEVPTTAMQAYYMK